MNIWHRLTQSVKTTQDNLLAKVKEQAFKCHLNSIRNVYDAINIQSLAKQFELGTDAVQSMISKVILLRRGFSKIFN